MQNLPEGSDGGVVCRVAAIIAGSMPLQLLKVQVRQAADKKLHFIRLEHAQRWAAADLQKWATLLPYFLCLFRCHSLQYVEQYLVVIYFCQPESVQCKTNCSHCIFDPNRCYHRARGTTPGKKCRKKRQGLICLTGIAQQHNNNKRTVTTPAFQTISSKGPSQIQDIPNTTQTRSMPDTAAMLKVQQQLHQPKCYSKRRIGSHIHEAGREGLELLLDGFIEDPLSVQLDILFPILLRDCDLAPTRLQLNLPQLPKVVILHIKGLQEGRLNIPLKIQKLLESLSKLWKGQLEILRPETHKD